MALRMDFEERHHLEQLTLDDRASFVFLHRRYQAQVYHYCLRLVRQPEVAEELCSDVFVRLWQKRHTLRCDLPLGGLLFKISRDACLSHLRQLASRADQRQQFLAHYRSETHGTAPTDADYDYHEGLGLAERAIESLPPRCQEVFRLRYTQGLSLQDIADRLQISSNTVQNHLLKGTRLVRASLQRHAELLLAVLLWQLP